MGEYLSRLRIAFFVSLFTMVSAVPATWTTDLINMTLTGWASVQSPLSSLNGASEAAQVPDASAEVQKASSATGEAQWGSLKSVAYVGLLLVSAGLAYLTVQAIGWLAAEVIGSDTIEKVDILVLPVSKPIRDTENKTASTIAEYKQLLEALVDGKAKLVKVGAGHDDGPMLADFATMTADRIKVIHGSGGVPTTEFAWQQSWRTLREQINSEKLKEIVLVGSASSSSEDDQDFQNFRKTLEFMIANEQPATRERFAKGLLKIATRKPASNGIEAIQEVYHRVIKEAPRRQRVGIDITSGDRIYAFAAGLSALHEKAVMFYVSKTDSGDEPKVACYDVRPKFR